MRNAGRMDIVTALISGIAAGLGLVAPLGAIGVLLIREGIAVGLKSGAAAAVGVALVDAIYCLAAVTAGAVTAPIIASWGSVPSIIGGAVLIFLGARGVVKALAASGTPVSGGAHAAAPSASRRFLLFIGLTATNPATLLYFAAVTVALGSQLSTVPASVAFIVGVAGASLCWQFGLIAVGAMLKTRITAHVQRLLSVAGFSIVIALGIASILVAVF